MSDNDTFLTRREAEVLIQAGVAAETVRLESYRREQSADKEAVEKALAAATQINAQHIISHDKAHDSHEAVHHSLEKAIEVALVAVAKERQIHAEAHEREHGGHLEVHKLNNLAIEKSDSAADKRFDAANGYRQIFESRMSETASQHSLNAIQKEYDRRIQALESNDLKAESLRRGQGSIVSYIVGAIAFFATFLTIIIVIANLLTNGRP